MHHASDNRKASSPARHSELTAYENEHPNRPNRRWADLPPLFYMTVALKSMTETESSKVYLWLGW